MEAVRLYGKGYVMRENGEKWRIAKLGLPMKLSGMLEKNQTKCDRCGGVFFKHGSKLHQSQYCRGEDVLDREQRRKRRQVGMRQPRRKGLKQLKVENNQLIAADGGKIKPTAAFVYLGTKCMNDGSMTEEVLRRIGKAAHVLASLTNVWKDNSIPMKLKVRLWDSLMISILLYGCELWTLSKSDLKMLDGFYFRGVRRITRKMRGVDDEVQDRAARETVFEAAEVVPVERIIRERRLRWTGHVFRMEEEEGVRKCLLEEERRRSKWWRQVEEDMRIAGIDRLRWTAIAADRADWRHLTSRYQREGNGARAERGDRRRRPENPRRRQGRGEERMKTRKKRKRKSTLQEPFRY